MGLLAGFVHALYNNTFTHEKHTIKRTLCHAHTFACPSPPVRPALARGVMQLYSVEQAKSQPLEAHAAAFSTVKFSGRDLPSNVITFAQKTLKDGQVLSKLHVIELGNAPGGQGVDRQEGGRGAAAVACGRQQVSGGCMAGGAAVAA